MKIIKPSHEYMDHEWLSPLEFIERIGRTCYKSTDKIAPGTAKGFVERLIGRKHWAMLEHDSIILEISEGRYNALRNEINDLGKSMSFLHVSPGSSTVVISGNLRAWHDLFEAYYAEPCRRPHDAAALMFLARMIHTYLPDVYPEHEYMPPESAMKGFRDFNRILSREDFLKKYGERKEIVMEHLTHSVKFICDRGVSHELVRHRPCSFAQESTRYVNYSQGKYGSEITVIEPFFYTDKPDQYAIWKNACETAEKAYMQLTELKSSPQEARSVLPNSLKTEIIMTATENEWQHIVNLRAKGTTGAPHPQMVETMMPWYEELKTITNGRIE